MDIQKASLVLEGGGMRGIYTGGVLEYFMERGLYFQDNYGVSAGACQVLSYLTRQAGRNKAVTIDLASDPRYISLKSWIKGNGLFNQSFIFDEIPNRLVPFHYDKIYDMDENLYVVVTDCYTGKPDYVDIKSAKTHKEMLDLVCASSSLPFVGRPVIYQGRTLMDGGVADSIPIEAALENGHKKHVAILTREWSYRKSEGKQRSYQIAKRTYRQYPGLVQAIKTRNSHYNRTRALLDQETSKGTIYPICPKEPLPVGRMDKDPKRLMAAYKLGYADGQAHYEKLMNFLGEDENSTI